MRWFLALFVIGFLTACQIGNLPDERERLYDKNQPNCKIQPEKCIYGYPW